ncbi:SIR2 family protein [Acinetobacter pittii]|uniref:SIR2 family NAD-dependent protein deacylase n=1 Tax=Acinetobacter pittii TaxID=48296 RepID=UPI00197EF268|nr:SIR2 family protein [Acinetobacter pittii]MBN6522421.1 SIR2 family protein [Acinetobacter pittii]
MQLSEFFSGMRNHPILFLGTGFSLRYLKQSYTWYDLLKKISDDLYGNPRKFLDLVDTCYVNGKSSLELVAERLETKFNELAADDERFSEINDIFYDYMAKGIRYSRFKIYICKLLEDISEKEEMSQELAELVKARKNIGSILTTNYDLYVEKFFKFSPLIGNNILLSNPYGSVYKIHGCVSDASSMVITQSDYNNFEQKYELIKAQILSLFMHNPIIFIGYGLGDENIRGLLKTIFSYVDVNSEQSQKIRRNFLLVEYDKNNMSTEVVEHDIDIEGIGIIRINKIKTDNFSAIYKEISNLILHVSAMEIRKVQSVYHEILKGEKGISVTITEDIDDLANNEMVLAIGAKDNIKYEFKKIDELIKEYFDILEEENKAIVEVINKHEILKGKRVFPIFGFSLISDKIDNVDALKKLQLNKIEAHFNSSAFNSYNDESSRFSSVKEILGLDECSKHRKDCLLFWNLYKGYLDLTDIESYLKSLSPEELKDTHVKRLFCLYDYKKYGEITVN